MNNSSELQNKYNKLLNNMEDLIKITNKHDCTFVKGKIVCGRMNNEKM
jgi:hypothetical protein